MLHCKIKLNEIIKIHNNIIITLRHDNQSQWENLKFGRSPYKKVAKLIITQLCTDNYVGEPYHHAKFHYDPLREF